MRDDEFMLLALEQAKIAESFDEVPVGVIITRGDEIVADGCNFKERKNCAVYHAEIVAIMNACEKLNNWYLDGCTMYVTLEPCPMCCGAIINSRLDRVVYGAKDPKSGGVESLYNILSDKRLNHTTQITAGVMEKECGEILTNYFRKKRELKKMLKAND